MQVAECAFGPCRLYNDKAAFKLDKVMHACVVLAMLHCRPRLRAALTLLQAKPTVAEMDVIGDMWAPYRSLGSYYMWRLPIHQKVAKTKTAKTSQAADVVPSVGVVPNIA